MASINGQTGGASGVAPTRAQNPILEECSAISASIEDVEKRLPDIRALQRKVLESPDASSNTFENRALNDGNATTMAEYRALRHRINSIKQQKGSGEETNKAQVGLVDRKLKKAIEGYQQVENAFKHDLMEQMKRQYRIVRPDATEKEATAAIEERSDNQIFSQAVSVSYGLFTLVDADT